MCYSAMVRQGIKNLQRHFKAGPDYGQIELIFHQCLQELSIRISRSFEANFDHPENAAERRIHDLIAEYRTKTATRWEKDHFAQKKRLADAERALAQKETRAAQESKRITTNTVDDLTRKLQDLKRTELKPRDSRIFPMYFAPIIINEGGENRIVLARYHCRPTGKPAAYDRKYPGLYNSRRNNLQEFWRGQFGHTHALIVVESFFENVDRGGKNAVLQFTLQTGHDMLIACLYSWWTEAGTDELMSFAAITDEPPKEVRDAGHDRIIINIKDENVAAWLTPEGRNIAELTAILDDVERPYYEHQVQAA